MHAEVIDSLAAPHPFVIDLEEMKTRTPIVK